MWIPHHRLFAGAVCRYTPPRLAKLKSYPWPAAYRRLGRKFENLKWATSLHAALLPILRRNPQSDSWTHSGVRLLCGAAPGETARGRPAVPLSGVSTTVSLPATLQDGVRSAL